MIRTMELVQATLDADWTDAAVMLAATVAHLNARGTPLWTNAQISVSNLQTTYARSELHFFQENGDRLGLTFLQHADPYFWPEVVDDCSLFLHKLAMLPACRGKGLGGQALGLAIGHARVLGKRWVRLDCDDRPPLCDFYEANGFEMVDRLSKDGYQIVRYQIPVT